MHVVGLLGLDEATNISEAQARFLMGWVRTTDFGQRTRVVMTFNPPTDAEWETQFLPWLNGTGPKPEFSPRRDLRLDYSKPEVRKHYLDTLRQHGLVISALTQREQLTEIIELPSSVHPWFIGVQFHPEFKSTPWNGHPLFNAFIKAALDHQSGGKNLKAVA